MDLLDTQREEIFINATNFEIDREDLRTINSRLNYLSDLCPMGSDLDLKMTLNSNLYSLELIVKNVRVKFNSLQNNETLLDAFNLADQDIHHQILEWKKNRFNNKIAPCREIKFPIEYEANETKVS